MPLCRGRDRVRFMSTESAPSVLQTRANIRRVIDTMVTRLAESDAVVNIGDYALCIASLAEAHQRLSPSYAPIDCSSNGRPTPSVD